MQDTTGEQRHSTSSWQPPASRIEHPGIEHPPVLQSAFDRGGSTNTPCNDPAASHSTFNLQPSTCNASCFSRSPGETPRAFSAFTAFFGLGHARSLQAVADQLDEKLDTVKKWSSRFRWSDRIHSFNSGLLHQQAQADAALAAQDAADWARRTKIYREREWEVAQKVLTAAECFLDTFGDQAVEKMTLAQVSRAIQISSRVARGALTGTAVPDGPVLVPLQQELAAALKKAYSNPPPEVGTPPPSPPRPGSGHGDVWLPPGV